MMFQINPARKDSSPLARITENYQEIIYDEFPILFYGTNYLGNKIIGSFICEDEDDDTKLWYFHLPVSSDQFFDFIEKRKTYLEIIVEVGEIYIIQKDFNNKVQDSFRLPLDEIPEDYLPLAASICPTVNHFFGYEYYFKLKGKLADMNETYAIVASKLVKGLADFMDQSSRTLKVFKYKPEVHPTGFSKGSFKIGYKLKFDQTTMDAFVSPDLINDYIAQYLKYCIAHFPSEYQKVVSDPTQNDSEEFHKLTEIVKDLYSRGGVQDLTKVEEQLVESLTDVIPKVLPTIGLIGNGFSEIEISTSKRNGEGDIFLSKINQETAINLNNTNTYLVENNADIQKDDPETQYKILIYQLNTDTRLGTAYITNRDNENKVDKPTIEIKGDFDLHETPFTQSIHLGEWITVVGQASLIKNKYKRIVVTDAT